MDREKWLEWRREGIGSSDASILMGVNPWKTKMDLYLDKIGEGVEQPDNAAMARGREMEPIILAMLEELFGCLLMARNVVHKDNDFIRCSLDAISFDGKMMCEIKTASQEDHELARLAIIPTKYIPQLQHQLLCTGADSMYYASYNCKSGELKTVLVKRDEAYIADLLQKETDFWNDHVIPRIPPDQEKPQFEDRSEDFAWNLTACEFIRARENADRYGEILDKCRENLIKISDNRPSTGGGIKLNIHTVQGRIDYKAAFHALLERSAITIPDNFLESFKGNSVQKFRIDVIYD